MEANRRDKQRMARKRVARLKGFYIHAIVYVLLNLFLTVISVNARMGNGEGFDEALFDLDTFVTPLFWGIGLAFHAAKVFGYSPFFGKDWEARQIQKFMDEDRREAERFGNQ